jgi:hypothetical protein
MTGKVAGIERDLLSELNAASEAGNRVVSSVEVTLTNSDNPAAVFSSNFPIRIVAGAFSALIPAAKLGLMIAQKAIVQTMPRLLIRFVLKSPFRT